jgi:hypothetical protein
MHIADTMVTRVFPAFVSDGRTFNLTKPQPLGPPVGLPLLASVTAALLMLLPRGPLDVGRLFYVYRRLGGVHLISQPPQRQAVPPVVHAGSIQSTARSENVRPRRIKSWI